MSSMDPQEAREQQRKDQYHSMNLQGQGKNQQEAAQVLHALSEVSDLPIQPEDDPVMGQLVSKLTSTANLSEEQVRSNEWVREYILILYLCKYPTEDGMHGSWRGYAHNDMNKERQHLDPETRLELETHVTTSKLALSRSEDAKVIEEGARDVRESVTSGAESSGSSSGILGRLGL